MKRLVITLGMVIMLASFAGISGLSVRPAEAATYNGTLPTLDCAGVNFSQASVTADRDNTGTQAEYMELVGFDGDGTQIMLISDTLQVGNNVGFSPFYAWSVAPDHNPITVRFVSPAGGKVGEQIVWEVTGECAGLPSIVVAGCDVQIPLTSTSVVGAFVADAPTSWTPGQLTDPLVTIPAGKTAWVLGQDASGQYYKIVWVCDLLWVKKSTMGPNYDAVWNGRPLPTGVVN
jgi:hypothetical protein